jgi:hypothetical protein
MRRGIRGHEDITKDRVKFEIYARQFLCYQRVFLLTVEYRGRNA